MSIVLKKFLVEPQLPFFYMPQDPYNQFKGFAQSLSDQLKCGNKNGEYEIPCYWEKECKLLDNELIDLEITIKDASLTQAFTFGRERLLMDGKLLGTAGRCYLGVYMHNTDSQFFYAGQSFLEGHYVSLSADPYYKDSNNKLLVGIGEIKPNAELGKQRYDPDYNGYDPLDEKQDRST